MTKHVPAARIGNAEALRRMAQMGEAKRLAIGATPEAIEDAICRERERQAGLPGPLRWAEWQGRILAASWRSLKGRR